MDQEARQPLATEGNAADWFVDRHVRDGRGGSTAFRDADRSLTYAALQRESGRFASGLARAGIGRECRIALVLLDSVDFPVAFWGALRAGVVPVPINTLLPADQTGSILADCRAQLLVVSAPLLPALRPVIAGLPALRHVIVAGGAEGTQFAEFLGDGAGFERPVQAHADEVAFWLYSSGSTSTPKGVRHVHASLRATADTYAAQVLGIQPDDVVFSAAKLFFAYGLGNAMTFPMSVGASSVLLAQRPTPDAVLEVMRTHQPSIFAGVPTLFAGLLAHPATGPGAGSARLRRCISAGEALPRHIGETWSRVVGTDILDGIGSTEMLHIFLSNRPDDVQYGTSGLPVPGYEVRVVTESGTDAAEEEPGELLVRGPSAAEGYWNQRAKSRSTFVGEWTFTGDKYVRQPDGYYRYCGRTDDMFKVSGVWVSPFEVEAALVSHPAVLEAAVVGHPDGDGLTKPRAFIVLKQGWEASAALREELQAHVKERAGPWKYPRWIEALRELPKTATGKIQRFKLREITGG
ncbi:MAG: benzoate-CoA ligase family protein [Acidisphaera sp.]|nr:benzoate-CoA ligase family protein [Acidisphaera sp.]